MSNPSSPSKTRATGINYDKILGNGVAVGLALGVIGGILLDDLLGGLGIGVGVSLLFGYIWSS